MWWILLFNNYQNISFCRRLSSKAKDTNEIKEGPDNQMFELEQSNKSAWHYPFQQAQTDMKRPRIGRRLSEGSSVSTLSRKVAPVHKEFSRWNYFFFVKIY